MIYQDLNGVRVEEVLTIDGVEMNAATYYNVTNEDGLELCQIDFQDGPVPEMGVNGVTNEALLSILIHRTEYLNKLYACPENEQALAGMRVALEAFEARTRDRIARGVEGKHAD